CWIPFRHRIGGIGYGRALQGVAQTTVPVTSTSVVLLPCTNWVTVVLRFRLRAGPYLHAFRTASSIAGWTAEPRMTVTSSLEKIFSRWIRIGVPSDAACASSGRLERKIVTRVFIMVFSILPGAEGCPGSFAGESRSTPGVR